MIGPEVVIQPVEDFVVIHADPENEIRLESAGDETTLFINDTDTPVVVEVLDEPSQIIELGVQGPPGPPGPTGTGFSTEGLAAVDLGGHRAVYMAADGLRYASQDDPLNADAVLGVTTGAGLAGSQITYKTHGPLIFPGSPFTPRDPVWLGVNGLLTQVPPASELSVVIGVAVDADTLHINIQPPVSIIN